MHSTDHNLNNPTRIDTLELSQMESNRPAINVEIVTQYFYDRLTKKDPNTIYLISDAVYPKMYLGNNLISNNNENDCRYYMEINYDKKEYIIGMIKINNYKEYVLPLYSYKDPQEALNKLELFSRLKSHSVIDSKLYQILVSYIDKTINIHDLIIGILSVYGFNSDSRLQNLINFANMHGVNNFMSNTDGRDLPELFKQELSVKYDKSINESDLLLGYYYELYKIIELNNFFKDSKYTNDPDNADLSKIIKEIKNIMK